MGTSAKGTAPLRHPGLRRTAGGCGTQPHPAHLADQVSPEAYTRQKTNQKRQKRLHNVERKFIFFSSWLWQKMWHINKRSFLEWITRCIPDVFLLNDIHMIRREHFGVSSVISVYFSFSLLLYSSHHFTFFKKKLWISEKCVCLVIKQQKKTGIFTFILSQKVWICKLETLPAPPLSSTSTLPFHFISWAVFAYWNMTGSCSLWCNNICLSCVHCCLWLSFDIFSFCPICAFTLKWNNEKTHLLNL